VRWMGVATRLLSLAVSSGRRTTWASTQEVAGLQFHVVARKAQPPLPVLAQDFTERQEPGLAASRTGTQGSVSRFIFSPFPARRKCCTETKPVRLSQPLPAGLRRMFRRVGLRRQRPAGRAASLRGTETEFRSRISSRCQSSRLGKGLPSRRVRCPFRLSKEAR